MKQAKSLRAEELKIVLAYIATRRHAVRDRAIVITSFLSGMRAHELASLRLGDVIGEDGRMRDEIALDASQTKGNHARRVFVNSKLKRELGNYIKSSCGDGKSTDPLFRSQKRGAFNANKGASSHSGRRTFITNLASKSVSVRVLAVLAGHSSISTTQRYIELTAQQQSEGLGP